MSNILSTEQLENISNDITTSTNTTPPKRGRGRPAKYATEEERKEKHLEAIKEWRKEHKEECKIHFKHFCQDNSDKINKAKTHYNDRARFALRVLSAMWADKETAIKDDKYKTIIENLIERKQILTI